MYQYILKWNLLVSFLCLVYLSRHTATAGTPSQMVISANTTVGNRQGIFCPDLDDGENITCVLDLGNNDGKMWTESSYASPNCISHTFSQVGEFTVYMYCVVESVFFFDDETVYVGEVISDVYVGDANWYSFITMISSVNVHVKYTNGTNVTIDLFDNTTNILLANKSDASTNEIFTVNTDVLSVLGQHAIRITLSNPLSKEERWIVIVLEEEILGFVYTGTVLSLVEYGQQVNFSFTISNGNDVVVATEIGSTVIIDKCYGKIRTYNLEYTYNVTGSYNVTMSLSNFVSSEVHSFPVSIMYHINNITVFRTGTVLKGNPDPWRFDMGINARVWMGTVNATIEITAIAGLNEDDSYTDTQYVNLTSLTPGNSFNYPMTFSNAGHYKVNITISNELSQLSYEWTEIVVNPLSLSLVASNTVPLSKSNQEIGVQITNPSHSPLFSLNCTFQINSDTVQNIFQRVNYGKNATIVYTYFGIENKTLSVNCTDGMDSWTQSTVVNVYTDCFTSAEFFSNIHKTESNPLKLLMTSLNQITGKIDVSEECGNSSRSYWWDLYIKVGNTYELLPYYNESYHQPSGVIITFAKDSIETPGLKKLVLTVNLTEEEGALLSDFIYLDFIAPPLFSKIEGGEEILASQDVDLTVVAYAEDAVKTFYATPFNYSWGCWKVPDTDTTVPAKVADFTLTKTPFYSGYTDCGVTLPDDKSVTVSATDLDAGNWYIFIVNVTKHVPQMTDSRESLAIQAVKVVNYRPLNLTVRCLRNCLKKVSNSSVVILQVVCEDCASTSTLTYDWDILELNAPSFTSITSISGLLASATTTADTIAFFPNLFPDFGKPVKLQCNVSSSTNGRSGFVSYILSVNQPPYGGSCSITPSAGNASLDKFTISCSDWKDEGDRSSRDDLADQSEPLMYTIYQRTGDSFLSLLSESGEPLTQSFLSMGNPSNNDQTQIIIQVTDIYMSYAMYYLNVTVENPLKSIVARAGLSSAEEVMQELQVFITVVMQESEKSKDPEIKVKMAETLISAMTEFAVVNQTDIEVSSLPDDWIEGLLDATVNGTMEQYADLLNDILQQPVDKYQVAATQGIKNLTDEILKILLEANSSTYYTVDNYANAFANSVLKLNYVDSNIAMNAGQALESLAESFSNLTADLINTRATFTSGTYDVEETFDSMARLMSNLVDATVPNNLHNQSDALMAAAAFDTSRSYVEVMAYMNRDTNYALTEMGYLTPEERTGMYFLRSRIAQYVVQEKQTLSITTGRAVNDAVEILTESLLNITCKGCHSITQKPELTIYLNKDTFANLQNPITIQDSNVTIGAHTSYDNTVVQCSTTLFEKNNYIYDMSITSALIASPVHKLTFTDENSEPITVSSVTIAQPVPPTGVTSVYAEPRFTPEDASALFYHPFLYRKGGDYVCFQVEQVQPETNYYYDAFVRAGQFPTHLTYDQVITVSKDRDFIACISPENLPATGLLYVGLRAHPIPGLQGNESISDPRLNPYNLTIITAGCETWNEKKSKWSGTSCQMDWFPAKESITCHCGGEKGMTFANTFYVPPNTIDFSTVFLKFSPADQAAVLATFILILVIYVLLMIWGRHQDKKDIVKWGVTPLIDNFVEDTYYYLVTVHTGMRSGAGTKSHIGFIVAGEEADTGVRELYDGVRNEFPTGSVMHFLMATSYPLGQLTYIYIFHDNSGPGTYSSWYLNRIDIEDLQDRTRYVFLCGKWLRLDDAYSSVDAVLPVCGKENVTTFKNMFYINTKDNLADNHIWVSIFFRPTSSHFTRIQRITCLLLFIMLTMIGNALYFKEEDDYENPDMVQVGPLQFSWRTVYISVMSTLISTPTTLLVVFLFKKSKPKVIHHDVKDPSLKYKVPVIDTVMDKWMKESIELERTLVAKGVFNTDGTILPCWCSYIAWFLALAGSVAAAFFTMLKSMEFGKQKTEIWLAQFSLSFVESVCIIDPLKVILMGAVFALIFKQLEKFRPSQMKREVILKNYKQRFSQESSIRIPSPPLCRSSLKIAREERMREVKMMSSVKQIIVTLIFMWIIYSICYSNRDNRSYYLYEDITNRMVTPQNNKTQFTSITTIKEYITWLKVTAFPALFPELDYNGDPLHWHWRQYFSGLVNFRVGPPRLRQLRVGNETANIPNFGNVLIYPSYSVLNEETNNFCFNWGAPPCNEKKEAYSFSYRAWKFVSALSIWGVPVVGDYSTYAGSGYIAELDVNWDFSNRTLDELTTYFWFDRSTRAIFLEFTVYNADFNLFLYAILIAEFPETGGVFTMYAIYPFRIYQHHGPTGYYVIFCEICFLLFLLALCIKVGWGIYKLRLAYFKSTWNTFDFVTIILSFTGIAMYIGRLILANQTLDAFKADPKKFVNFSHIVYWDFVFNVLLGTLAFLVTLRLLGILGYDKRIGQVLRVFDNCAWDLFWFGVLFLYIFVIYSVLGYLLFGRDLDSYHNVFESLGTLFISMIGKSKFSEINDKDPIMAQLYFFTYVLFIVYFLLTMFLAILCESINLVHQMTKDDRSEELIVYLIEKLKGFFTSRMSKNNSSSGGNFSSIHTLPNRPINLLQELRDEIDLVMFNASRDKGLKDKMEKKKMK